MFPLPDCVLFPGVALPLHVFEMRYRLMMRDILSQPQEERWVTIALLKPRYAHLYETARAPVFPVACLGKVVQFRALEDGRFDIIVLGVARVTVLGENREETYRRVQVAPFPKPANADPLSAAAVRGLRSLLKKTTARGITHAKVVELLEEMVSSPEQWIDMLAFNLMSSRDCEVKQRILGEPDVRVRAEVLSLWLQSQLDLFERSRAKPSWPPHWSLN